MRLTGAAEKPDWVARTLRFCARRLTSQPDSRVSGAARAAAFPRGRSAPPPMWRNGLDRRLPLKDLAQGEDTCKR